MARISTSRVDRKYRVTVSGRLLAADLGRLERACGPALEQRHVALELRLTRVSAMDAAARVFVQRLVERGAVLVDARGDGPRDSARP